MKVLIATPLYPPEVGGPATYAEILKQAWGRDALLVKFSDVRKYPKILRHVVYFLMVLKAARNTDVVLALDPVSVGLPAMKAAQKAGKKFVVKIVGDYAWEQGVQRFGVTQTLDDFVKTEQSSFAVRRLQQIQNKVAQGATGIIVPSEYLQEIVMQWGIPKEKIIVINNGIKLPEHIPMQQKKEGEFLIVSAGRRVPWKGFEALERIADISRHSNWRLKIFTDSPREEVLSWIKTADVFVLNSHYEGFSHVLVEAMTLGTPVVVTNIRANKSLVGGAGLLVSPRDDTALEQALIEVERNPKEAQDRARAGQERAKSFELSYTLDLTANFLKLL